MSERDFWIAIRACLIQMTKAIERRYQLGAYSDAKPLHPVSSETRTDYQLDN